MSYRLQIALAFLAPVLLLGGLYVLGLKMPVPYLGRGYVIRIQLPDPGAKAELPKIEGVADASRPLVVIDAGHGGHDPGASGDGFREKTVVLGLALALRERLLRDGGVRVALTRNDDRFLVVGERAEIARALGADLFLSIHADSAGDRTGISGASVYTLSQKASSEAAARFAARENSADEINGIRLDSRDAQVNDLLIELSQRNTLANSKLFADLIVREGKGGLQFHPTPERSASLLVLRTPDMPSVLYEAGYITNPEDAQRLASPEGRAAFADTLSRAIRIYFARQSPA